MFGKQSYYDLTMTRHVEPQNKDNADEAELRQRGEGGRKLVANEDDVRSGALHGGHARWSALPRNEDVKSNIGKFHQ